MEARAKTQRPRGHRKPADSSVIHVEMKDGVGNSSYLTANLVDVGGGGCGLALMSALKPGSTVVLRGKFRDNRTVDYLKAGVKWCMAKSDRTFHVGLKLLDQWSPFILDGEQTDSIYPVAPDCYEVMQLHPNADAETISRVYRILAFRYHPDNAETGDSETFIRLSEAHQILSDPEKRASYDATLRHAKPLREKNFGQASVSADSAWEKRRSLEDVTAAYLGIMSPECTVRWEG